MSIEDNLNSINEILGKSTKLVAISKTKTWQQIMECYNLGQKVFGENKVQELVEKHNVLPIDIEWHLVGHLQRNKVKYLAPFVTLIHSVDSLDLLKEINKQGIKCNRIINCLLQIYIAKEETKFGLNEEEALALLLDNDFKALKNVHLLGVMGMATNTNDRAQIRGEFRSLKRFSDKLIKEFSSEQHPFLEVSMGMSHDYEMAIEEGSTLVRVGSRIFGER